MEHNSHSIFKWILILIITSLSFTQSHSQDIDLKDKELIDKAFNKSGLVNETDDSAEKAFLLFNKMEDIDDCFNKSSTNPNHYYVFNILSKFNKSYYEFYYGVCLEVNETTLNQYVNEDYLMFNSSITASQIVKRKKLYPQNNFKITSICIIGFILLYILFCVFIWQIPCQSSPIENNDSLLKQESINLPPSNQLQVAGLKSIERNEDVVGIGAKIKQKQLIEQVFNSFNIKTMFEDLFTQSQRNKNIDKEIKVLFGIKALCYIIVMLYTCAPIFFKPPMANPDFLIETVKSLPLQLIYNGDVLFDVIISIDVFITLYAYLSSDKPLTIKEILLDIIGKISETYFSMLIVYLIFWKVLPISGPLSNLFFTYERESCQAQMIPILSLFSNMTFGLYETSYPYCVYHFWFIHLSIQYFLIAILFVVIYKYKPSVFYPLFFFLSLYIFFIQLWNTSTHPTTNSFYDVLRRNPSMMHMDSAKKIFTRIMPLLIGIFVSILYKTKKDNCISSLTKGLCKSLCLFTFGVGLFAFWFLIHYLTINNYNDTVFKAPAFLFFYCLFKRTMISISFFMFFIPIVVNGILMHYLSFIFNNALMNFMDKIAVGMYLTGAIIARILFYHQTWITQSGNVITTRLFTMSIFAIITLSIISSVIITALFKIPFVRMWLIIKHKLI